MTYRFLGAGAIAAITAVVTISMTHYLLGRPWCVHLDAKGNQTIQYGDQSCVRRESRMIGQTSPYPTSSMKDYFWP